MDSMTNKAPSEAPEMPKAEVSQLDKIRHSLAHLLAAAVLKEFPDAKLGIGPTIENGFYYDFLLPRAITPDDLKTLEKTMRGFVNKKLPFSGREVTAAEAKKIFAAQPFKLDLINEFAADGKKLTVYETSLPETSNQKPVAILTDLCRGGHVENTSEIPADGFKLDKIAGAYWRGDEKNQQLQRIYGLAFESKEKLKEYEVMIEEAKKRDHRILGKQLKLFTISDLIGAGLPLLQPKGMIIRRAIEDYLWELHAGKGYSRVWTPHIAKDSLYVTSGHAAKFGDELFRVQGKEEKFILKPMNCPHHMQIFTDNQFSYRDMPVRYFEPATVYRDEKSGELSGLTRVRSVTQDDGHLFCRVSQIEDEVKTISGIIKKFYATMGMMDDYWVSLSVRGDDRSKYLGTDENWQAAESALEEAAKSDDLPYRRVEGEAAFYGPKLDFMFKDAIGRQWQLATIQCDFNLPERFDLSFVNEKGEKERPVVIHRAISGSLERFMGVLIEHFAGKFPVWLAPVQAMVIPVGEKFSNYGKSICDALEAAGIRVEFSEANESLGKRIRVAEMMKIPYILVVGEKEETNKTVNVRSRDGEEKESPLADFVKKIEKEIKEKTL
jgi:threonyl-tRNA synthetase